MATKRYETPFVANPKRPLRSTQPLCSTCSVTARLYPQERHYNPPSMRGLRVLVPLLAALLLIGSPAASASTWKERKEAAVRYLEAAQASKLRARRRARADPRLQARRASRWRACSRPWPWSPTNLPSVRDRPLHDSDRRLLGPMVRRSDNATAGTVLRTVGGGRGCTGSRSGRDERSASWPIWGNSRTSAHDQARFFFRIDRLIARRHRSYALRLLRTSSRGSAGESRRRVRPAGRSTSRAAGDPAPASSRISPPSW